ncbi:ThiS family protein [compost metagenome]
MQISIRLFAGLAEIIGTSSLSYHVEHQPLTVGKLKELLSSTYPNAASQIAISMVAVDQEYAPDDIIVDEASEVAIIPPVSGG